MNRNILLILEETRLEMSVIFHLQAAHACEMSTLALIMQEKPKGTILRLQEGKLAQKIIKSSSCENTHILKKANGQSSSLQSTHVFLSHYDKYKRTSWGTDLSFIAHRILLPV